jgi:hypothetical protein
MESGFNRSLAAMEARLETFCEYILSITHDRLAASNGPERGALTSTDFVGLAAEAKQLLSEIRKESSDLQKPADRQEALNRFPLLPDTEAYIDGWNYPETGNDGRPFRWMKRVGQINLPCSANALFCIVVEIGKIFNNLPPTFFAKIDDVQADVQCFALAAGFELKITPLLAPSDGSASGPSVLTLECAAWGSPFDDGFGSDRRELSALVWAVEVFTNAATA